MRRQVVLDWLHHLSRTHPDYHGMDLSMQNLHTLPVDGSVHTLLPTRGVNEMFNSESNGPPTSDLNDAPNHALNTAPTTAPTAAANAALNAAANAAVNTAPTTAANTAPTTAANAALNAAANAAANAAPNDAFDEEINLEPHEVGVPDFRQDETELQHLQRAVQSAPPALSMASFRQTPLSEWEKKCVFRMAFPSLFPCGLGDFFNPRTHEITFKDWISHVLRYKDGRFARHPRFRYVAFNMWMRLESKKSASYLCKQLNGQPVTLDMLQEQAREGSGSLSNQISRMGQKLRGTRPYWLQKGQDLEAMALNLDTPHLFFTLSAADLQWHDLRQQMPGSEQLSELSEQEQLRKAAHDLTDNPHIAACYLVQRVKLFFECVVKKVFHVKDYWYRYEWQDRGSGHVHGFLWLEGPPPPRTTTEEECEAVAMYWSDWVTAINPHQTLLQAGRNPASMPFAERSNTLYHLTESLNRFQRHTKCTSYCQRKDIQSGELRCRFHYPKPYQITAAVNRDENPRIYKYMAPRDDTILNAFIAVFLFAWNANTDMSPTPNLGSMIRYAAKYASKCEVRSEPFKVMFANAIRTCGERNPFLSASMKMLNRFIGEREWSAQETMHHLYDKNLVECTREIVPLGLRPPEQQATVVDIEDGEITQRGQSWLAKYVARMSYLDLPSKGGGLGVDVADVTLFEFVRDWVVRKVKIDGVQSEIVQRRPRAKSRVLRIFPKYSYLPDGEQYENYCRVKLMLHHPFVDFSDLRMPNADGELSYAFAYDVCCRDHSHPRDPIDVRDEEVKRKEQHPEEEEGSEADFERLSEHDSVDPQDAWTDLAARNGGPEKRLHADYGNLGKQPLDVDYDWHASDAYYQEHGDQHDWYERKKTEVSGDINRLRYSPDTLQGGQWVFFDLLTNHCSQLFGNRSQPFRN